MRWLLLLALAMGTIRGQASCDRRSTMNRLAARSVMTPLVMIRLGFPRRSHPGRGWVCFSLPSGYGSATVETQDDMGSFPSRSIGRVSVPHFRAIPAAVAVQCVGYLEDCRATPLSARW